MPSNYTQGIMNLDHDPWADTANQKKAVAPSIASNTNSLSASLNIFGDSSTGAMSDSMVGAIDPIAYTNNNSWGEYNSFNILSNANHSANAVTKSGSRTSPDAIAHSVSSLNINNRPASVDSKAASILGTKNIFDRTLESHMTRNVYGNDDFDDDEDEEEFSNPLEVRIWTDEEVCKFNPLSLKNAKDGLFMKVREIPEKEGLVFKHTNYLISHSLKFSSEYTQTNDAAHSDDQNNSEETKVIRRYSDFAWLVEALWKKYPFRLIPELPPKKFGSSSNDVLFLQKRRRGLERFLFQLCKHPVLSKENLVIMFLTVPNDFSNWKKFANIELNDEFDGVRVNLPRRFRIDVSDVLKGLRDTESEIDEIGENEEETTSGGNKLKNRDEFVNNVNQIWNESPTSYKDKEFITRIRSLNENLSQLAEIWSKLYILVERIEKREVALATDHQRFALFLDSMTKIDTSIYSMSNLVENKSRRVDEETNNMSIINSIFSQISKYFVGSRKLKEEEMQLINNQILESWKKFHDYLISLHFLIERFFNYKAESEKQIHLLLQKIIKTNERLLYLKGKSDIRGSEIDRHLTVLTESMDQLSMLISRIILIKTTFLNEFKIFQKTKYMTSEVFQDWFEQRSKYFEMQNDSIQKLMNDLKDLPLGN